VAAGGLPDLLTVEEAAALLRIGRNKAYGLARQWRATNGRTGLPVIEFGHTLRVPRHALERMIGAEFTGPAPTTPLTGERQIAADHQAGGRSRRTGRRGHQAAPAESKVTPSRRRRRSGPADQLFLFESPKSTNPEHP
jgi:hypothetical protein